MGFADSMCQLATTLNTEVFMPLAFIGALIGIIWAGVAYAGSGIFPEASQRARNVPKNVLIGFAFIAFGPALLTTVATTFGLGLSCTL